MLGSICIIDGAKSFFSNCVTSISSLLTKGLQTQYAVSKGIIAKSHIWYWFHTFNKKVRLFLNGPAKDKSCMSFLFTDGSLKVKKGKCEN